MTLFPEADALACRIAKDAAEKWERLAQVRSAVLVALEQARAAKTIGGGLEAKVQLHAGPQAAGPQRLLAGKKAVLPPPFFVSQGAVQPSPIAGSISAGTFSGLAVRIESAARSKIES